MDYEKLINCMRCGLCLPHCPTYRETFLETASPRGRIALVRKVLEGELQISEKLLEFLSLCLDCQACASACPCGVNAGELVAGFRCEKKVGEGFSFLEDLVLHKLLPHPDRLEYLAAPVRLYQRTGLQKLVRSLGMLKMFSNGLARMEDLLPRLPQRPLRQVLKEETQAQGEEKGVVGFFLGCVMSLIFPDASFATVSLLSALGYRVITPRRQKCCGAPHMLGADVKGLQDMAKFNVELFSSFHPDLIITDCGGCGAELKNYGHHLPDNPGANVFSSTVRDICQLLAERSSDLSKLLKPLHLKVTYHDPCHLAHCQGIRQEPRLLLKLIPGLDYREMDEADACCGSAGTYNIGQPDMSDRVLRRKVDNIMSTGAGCLVTANPGCLLQLKKALSSVEPPVEVVHVTELLMRSMRGEDKDIAING